MKALKSLMYNPLLISLIISLPVGCSDTIGTMQDFKHNKYPEITSFTCDPSGSMTLDPNTPVTLTVTATDPEGEKLKFSYDSEDGSFTGQSDTDDTSTVTFYSASYLTSSEPVKARVKVTDDKKFSVSQEIEIGSTKSGPTITSIGSIPAYISSDSEAEYTFSANSSGLYQVQTLSSGTSSASFSSSYATYFYGAGEYITVTICGNDLDTGDAKMTVNTEGAANNIAVVLQDSLGSETCSIFKLTVDDTLPESSVVPATETSSYLTAIPVTISATDNASGVSKISYTVDGSSPDFSGSGTVVNGSNAKLTLGKSGTSGIGTYTLNYISMDNCGNIEALNTATYYIKSDTTATGPVSSPILSQICDDTIVVTYALPTDSDFDHVQAVCTSGGGIITQATSDSNTCIISSLTADTSYTIIIYAYDTYDNQSDPSDSISITTPTSSYSNLMDVYYIKVLSDLTTLQGNSGYWDNFCLLVNDITAGTSTPIGNGTTQFTGFFEGNSHKIIGLTLSNSSGSYQGFFGYILGGTVRNLNLTNVSVTGGSDTGGLVGRNTGVITGCSISGEVTGYGERVGGLAGYNVYVSGVIAPYIYNCSSSVNVTVNGSSYNYVGGLVGWNRSVDGTAVISNSHADGTVSASSSTYVGGLAGENFYDTTNYNSAEITDCYATGSVTGYELVGALVGHNYDIIENCYASGNVSGSINTGGIAGQNYTYGKITNSYYGSSTGEISGGNLTGGLIGGNYGTVSQCYAIGKTISGTLNVGGLIGYNTNTVSGISTAYTYAQFETLKGTYFIGGLIGNNTGSLSYCYADVDVTSTDTGTTGCIGGLIGRHADSTVQNCHSTGTITGTYYTGGLIGQNVSGTITNCYSETDVTATNNDVGGLIGLNSDGTVSGCHATGSSKGYSFTGGLVGDNSGTITDCYASATVATTSGGYAGGLIGYNADAYVTYCYASGDVSGNNNVGGLVGASVYSSETTSINYCYATGNVTGRCTSSYAGTGGIAGCIYYSSVYNCYYANSDSGVIDTAGTYSNTGIGGIVGFLNGNGSITHCYTTAPIDISGTGIISMGIGGILGGMYDDSVAQIMTMYLYYNSETTGYDSGTWYDMGTASTTDAMKQSGTYENFDFGSTWAIDSLNNGYPYLQSIPPAE